MRLDLLKLMYLSAGACDPVVEKQEAQGHLEESQAQAAQMAEADKQNQVHQQ